MRERVLAYLERMAGSCFVCALNSGNPYALAYQLMKDPQYFARENARIEELKKRESGELPRHTRYMTHGYERFDCHLTFASGPVPKDNICFACKREIE